MVLWFLGFFREEIKMSKNTTIEVVRKMIKDLPYIKKKSKSELEDLRNYFDPDLQIYKIHLIAEINFTGKNGEHKYLYICPLCGQIHVIHDHDLVKCVDHIIKLENGSRAQLLGIRNRGITIL